MFYVPKALLCVNIKSVLQVVFQLQEKQYYALYAFVRRLKLHEFNYTVITYGYFGLRSWDKDHSAQHEPANPMIYKFPRKYKG